MQTIAHIACLTYAPTIPPHTRGIEIDVIIKLPKHITCSEHRHRDDELPCVMVMGGCNLLLLLMKMCVFVCLCHNGCVFEVLEIFCSTMCLW